MTHNLKCWPTYFKAIKFGKKLFDIRINDRDFKEGETAIYHEYDPSMKEYSGDKITVKIIYVMKSPGGNAQGWKLSYNAVVMGIELIDPAPAFTSLKPKKEGFYWYRLVQPAKGNGDISYSKPAICAVTMSYLSSSDKPEREKQGLSVTLLGDWDVYMLDDCADFEWLGPIDVPKGE